MRIYTRTGDGGQTQLGGGERRAKHDLRVEAYGTVDEAGAAIGLAEAVLDPARDADVLAVLAELQQLLWDCGSDLALAAPGARGFRTEAGASAAIERHIDRFAAELPPLGGFIVRTGSRGAVQLHWACTVLRRAERRAHALAEVEAVHPDALQALNRASDLLFVLARLINQRDGRTDVPVANRRARGAR